MLPVAPWDKVGVGNRDLVTCALHTGDKIYHSSVLRSSLKGLGKGPFPASKGFVTPHNNKVVQNPGLFYVCSWRKCAYVSSMSCGAACL